MKKMTSKEFKKLLKSDTPKHILFRYIYSCYPQVEGVSLTSKQLQQVIDLKNKKSADPVKRAS